MTAGSATQYAYDGLGLRAERNAGGTVRRFVYDLSGDKPRVLMETDGSQNSSFVAGFQPMRFEDGWGIVTPTSDADCDTYQSRTS